MKEAHKAAALYTWAVNAEIVQMFISFGYNKLSSCVTAEIIKSVLSEVEFVHRVHESPLILF